MGIELNLNPDDVDQLVKETIMKSAFGTLIIDSVKKALNSSSYNNPIDTEMNRAVQNMAREVIEKELGGKIREMVKVRVLEKLTDEVIGRVTDKSIDTMVEAFRAR
jgi:hypothetical protein